METKAAVDLYAAVTGRIVAALERGAPPWVRPWSQDVDSMPMNAAGRRPYRGINALLLTLEANSQGYPLNRWLTYRQAAELGGQVRRGERGTTVVLWRLRKLSATANTYPDEGESDLHERVIPLLRAFTVFNVAQIDGVRRLCTLSNTTAGIPMHALKTCCRCRVPPSITAAHERSIVRATTRSTFRHPARSPMRGITTPQRYMNSPIGRRIHHGAIANWGSGSEMTLTPRRS